MHMSDALLSPAVGGSLWGAALVAAGSAARKVRTADAGLVPLMGVLGAFVFAAQMVNFAIPGTGSSGHLCGGVLLSALLGPSAAFLVMASVLAVQALFFADGGLLALGANAVNLGLLTCFIAYPAVFRPLAGPAPRGRRLTIASLAASVAALQLGALGVVIETSLSGISTLPFRSFALLMLPLHLAIGVCEGLVTAAVLAYVWKAHPELLAARAAPGSQRRPSALAVFAIAAAVTAGALAAFASTKPDGLEWSVARLAGAEPRPGDGAVHRALATLQARTAFLAEGVSAAAGPSRAAEQPALAAGFSHAGLVGAGLTLVIACAAGVAARAARGRSRSERAR